MRYARLLSRLYNTPLAISEAKLAIITSNVTLKLLQGEAVGSMERKQPKCDSGIGGETEEEEYPALPETWEVIEVFGSLCSKNGAGESGCTSYAYITEEINEAIAEGKTHLIFSIDSHGGEVAGNFTLASFIGSLPSKYGIQTFAFVDGYACSAAYTIASACQKVYATPSSFLGSIGVLMTLVDCTEEDKLEGEKYTILRSRSEKALYNPHEKLSSKVVTEAEKTLAQLDGLMGDVITKNRSKVTQEIIASLNGVSLIASEALASSLCDTITASFDTFISAIKPKASSASPSLYPTILGQDPRRNSSMNLEQAVERIAALESELATLKAEQQGAIAAAALSERARVSALIDAGKLTGITADTLTAHIKAGTDEKVGVAIFTGIKAGLDASTTAVLGSASDMSSLSVSDLLASKAAKEAAASATPKTLAGGLLSVTDLINAMTSGESHA